MIIFIAEAPVNSFMSPTIDATFGIRNKAVPDKYEMIRRSLEDSIPNSTVHIYGSCLYMGNASSSTLDLHIELGNFPFFTRNYLQNGIKFLILHIH